MNRTHRQGLIILGIGLVLALLLALPGATVTTKYLNDLYIFLDGAHRLWTGQIPNVDFHSSLGPLAFVIPAAGYGLTGSMGAAMPVGMALVVLALSLAAWRAIAARMRPALGLLLALHLLLVAAVPMNPGESIADLSFAMFYNRIGWAALGLLLVMYLPPARPRPLADAVVAAGLTVAMLALKVSYGLVGLVFLGLLLTDRAQRGWAALALVFCGLALALTALLWDGAAGHIADLRLASEVSGELPDAGSLAQIALNNLPGFVTLLFVFALVLWQTRSLRDLAFVGFAALAGLLIIEQNFQTFDILTLGVAAAVGAERFCRQGGRLAPGMPLLLASLLLPLTAQHGTALGLHVALAGTGQGEPSALPRFAEVRLVRLWREGPWTGFRRYEESLADGAEALARLPDLEKVLVLDFVNPFSAGLGLNPPQGDSPWHHWGRTVDEVHYLPDSIFDDVQVVLDPKAPIEGWTARGLRDVHAQVLAERFVLVEETDFWRVYVAKEFLRSAQDRQIRVARHSISAQP